MMTNGIDKAVLNNREILGMKLKAMACTDKKSVEPIGVGAWKFKDVEVGSSVNDYVVRLEPMHTKTGRTFHKRELYKVVDGVEKQVNLGVYKKDYLYKVVNSLTKVNTSRKLITQGNEDEIRKMSEYIRAHKDEFKTDGKVTTGTIPGFGDIKYIAGTIKPMKNCHKRVFGRMLYVNGELHSEGGGLHLVDEALNGHDIRRY